MPMIYCSECGSPASPKAPHCPKCGHPLQAVDQQQAVAQQPVAQPVVNVTVTQTQSQGEGVLVRHWNPLIAALLSFIIPGLGQLYKGQPISGIIWFLAVGFGYVCFIIPGVILHICCILGAAMGGPYR